MKNQKILSVLLTLVLFMVLCLVLFIAAKSPDSILYGLVVASMIGVLFIMWMTSSLLSALIIEHYNKKKLNKTNKTESV